MISLFRGMGRELQGGGDGTAEVGLENGEEVKANSLVYLNIANRRRIW